MSSFDDELDGVCTRMHAFATTPASRRAPEAVTLLRADLERLRRRADDEGGEGTQGADLHAMRVRHLGNVGVRLEQIERLGQRRADQERRLLEGRRPTLGPAARGSGARGERDRFVARAALLVALSIGAVAALRSAAGDGERAEAEARAGRPRTAGRRLTSDEVAELVRKRASADFVPFVPEVRPAAVFRDSHAAPRASGDAVPAGEVALRIARLKNALTRASRCAVPSAPARPALPFGFAEEEDEDAAAAALGAAREIEQSVLLAQRDFHAEAAELARLAPRCDRDAVAFLLELSADPDPTLSSIGRQLVALARSPEADRWLADGLRSGEIEASDTAIETAVMRGGDELHGALLALARSGERTPARARRLALEGIARMGRTGDALELLALAADDEVGLDAARASAALARQASDGGDYSVEAAVAAQIRGLRHRALPLLHVAASLAGGSAQDVLREEAASLEPTRRRAVLDAVRAFPSKGGLEVAALLADDRDATLAADAKAFLSAGRK